MMKLFPQCLFVALTSAALLNSNTVLSADYKVANQQEYAEALSSIEKGDSIILANGVWNDFEILFEGKGSKDQPIKLMPETKGQVILSGQSNLRLAGEH